MEKTRIIAIVGPTASGKTALSIALAKRMDGEIVSADSMQVYRGMDIGTAKPTEEEKNGIPHHMMDVADLCEDFSVARYCEMAHQVIADIVRRGKFPILVGGTGLYVDSLLRDVTFGDVPGDEPLRESLHQLAEREGNEAVYRILCEEDEPAAKRLHPNNLRRVIRAIEMKRLTGISILEHEEQSLPPESRYDALIFGMAMEREVLYDRINRRVDQMLKEGLMQEVSELADYLRQSKTSVQGLGYKELIESLDGRITEEEAVEILKRDTRRYAKRQMTWFRRNPDIIWLDTQETTDTLLGIIDQTMKERWG